MTTTSIENSSRRISNTALAAILLTTLIASLPAHAQTETVLYNFCSLANCNDGASPSGGVIADAAGNLYGNTLDGGAAHGGVVYKLTPSGDESVLYPFHDGFPDDGYGPAGLLAMDAQGNLYGTTEQGGRDSLHVVRGDGIVFKVSPQGDETILYNFGAFRTDGIQPIGGMVLDAKGNLYGTTYIGGTYTLGTVFRLTPEGEETVLHNFAEDDTDGGNPWAPLIIDGNGNVFGTTPSGGDSNGGAGTVFEITAAGVYKVLHIFTGPPGDGGTPFYGLTLDSQGNLYGATYAGGTSGGRGSDFGAGTVFKLSPQADGSWTETILYNFTNQTDSCQNPFSNVVFDAHGNLYGTTFYGGAFGQGCVYALTPAGKFSNLHTFGRGKDSAEPMGNLLFWQGSLYGTTIRGGDPGLGTVFKMTP